MKALIICGSHRKDGVGAAALGVFCEQLRARGITPVYHEMAEFSQRGCTACRACSGGGGCVFGDLGALSRELSESVGLVVASPVYYASPSGSVISLLDRLFQSTKHIDKRMKLGAAIVTARRGGGTASLEVLHKYFSISEMPIVSSSYWPIVYGEDDSEGLATVRRLAESFAELAYKISDGRTE